MKCPVCPDIVLVMMNRQGVEIDHCSQCRGVWLDRGELEKLIERADPAPNSASQTGRRYQDDFRDSDHRHHSSKSRNERKKSWLSEIFD